MAKRSNVKCNICNQLVPIEDKYILKYTNKNNIQSKKQGHKSCCESWHKDYMEYNELEEYLLDLFGIPALPKTFIQRLRELHKDYSYEIINKTAIGKAKHLESNFDKGWNYLFAIINNSIAQVYVAEENKKDKNISGERQQQILEIDMSKSKKIDVIDYSNLLD